MSGLGDPAATAHALIEQGRPAEALAAIEPFAKLPNANLSALSAYGLALKANGRLQDALQAYRRGVKVDPSSPIAEHNVGATLGDLGQHREAEAAMRRAIAKGGQALLSDKALAAFKARLIPRADLLTPNAPEAEALTGIAVADLDGQRRAGEALLKAGAKAVLVKGGHVLGGTVTDVLLTPSGETLLEGPRINTRHTHGTGCTLASACATGLAQGLGLEESVARAWAYVAEAIRRAPGFGQGFGPLNHGWPLRKP